MPEYRYEIITKDGKTERGKISAASQLEALQLLNSQGFVVTSIKPISKTRKRKRSLFPIQPKELSLFSRQLATMVSSGVRIRDALQVLSKQTMFSRRFRKILVEVVLLIESGEGFSDALEKTRVFDELFVNLVRAGETGGVLDEALQRVAEFYEGMVDLQNQVKSAMSYPLFMMAFAVGIVGVISFFILPNLMSAFGTGFEPGGVMGFLLWMNSLLTNHGVVVAIAVVMFFIGAKIFMMTKYGLIVKNFFGSIIPPVRKLRETTALERFTRTLAVLVASGVDLPTSLELAAEVSESTKIMNGISLAVDMIRAGEPIHVSLEKQKIFPSIVISMVSTGEETGKLDEVMFKVADFYHAQVTTSLKKLVSLVEPIMIMFIGGFIGFLAYTMYNTIFSMEQAMGG
ncbi:MULTISPECIES: type II secretion system F family protein [Kosmotoga]|uniref:Type II secretion system protein n=1 Tax=Kosmotoga olearia (strain ATCC BAA-1733 / DSM 21960 / TBF 19.5.1) TaxID=521045 RepID=C5CGG6_KOSOT|nr:MULTISPECIES: type II secretion system F family protein [Kosmotoga]ACR80547.1 type II secretion system protein [Kosmotoga olearia TBF 19.5.1]MDI3523321.1 type pilus assembly protein PilC [Kosmotoga sp.]MDK2952749.1 type pilus assembly protein PilC [Kosmotoga sp.]OAA19417.1 secretion system protein [Kosmotoga sp. DU53]